MTQFAEPRQLYAAPIVASMELDLLERSMELGRQDIAPHLVAYTDENTSPTQNYLQMKEKAGRRLGVIVTVVESTTASLASHLAQGSADPEISGVILQLPVAQRSIQGQDERRSFTDMLLNIVPGNRDVDGLGELSLFTPATVLGVMQLLHHYDPDFRQKSIALYGDGRLVNRPLRHLLADSMGASELNSVDDTMTDNEKAEVLHAADIIIAATGDPHSLTTQLVGTDRSKLIIDAGTSEKPKEPKEMAKSKDEALKPKKVVLGDVSDELRAYATSAEGWAITPRIGGVGPLTVLNLLANVIKATEDRVATGTMPKAWLSDSLHPSVYADRLLELDLS